MKNETNAFLRNAIDVDSRSALGNVIAFCVALEQMQLSYSKNFECLNNQRAVNKVK
jgi:hypothetical protein